MFDRSIQCFQVISTGALFAFLSLGACGAEHHSDARQNQTAADCQDGEEWVEDVCIELGPDDGCVKTGDRCIRLCAEGDDCGSVAEGELCPVDPWPVAPDGYCVAVSAVAECEDGEEWVEDVCIELGPDDGCVETGDRCIRLCAEGDDCGSVAEGDLCAVHPWPVAPDGYCVATE